MINASVVSYAFQPEFNGVLANVLSYGKTWILSIIGSFVVLIPDFLYEMIRLTYFPSPIDKVVNFIATKKEHHVKSSMDSDRITLFS